MSSVATDSKDGNGLKILVLRLKKSLKNIVLDLVLLGEICLISFW